VLRHRCERRRLHHLRRGARQRPRSAVARQPCSGNAATVFGGANGTGGVDGRAGGRCDCIPHLQSRTQPHINPHQCHEANPTAVHTIEHPRISSSASQLRACFDADCKRLSFTPLSFAYLVILIFHELQRQPQNPKP
jgi:hypothetical protein